MIIFNKIRDMKSIFEFYDPPTVVIVTALHQKPCGIDFY